MRNAIAGDREATLPQRVLAASVTGFGGYALTEPTNPTNLLTLLTLQAL